MLFVGTSIIHPSTEGVFLLCNILDLLIYSSNDYMYSLVYDFGFEVKRYVGYTTADIFPPTHNAFVVVWNVLENYLVQDGSFNGQIDCIHQYYIEGWSK